MASTVREVGNLALRKLGIVRSGGTASASEMQDCLEALSSLYQSWIDGGAFGRVTNVPMNIQGTFTSGVNQHLNVLVDDTVTIDLPSTVPYGYWNTWMAARDYGWGLNVPLGGDDGYNVPPDKSVVMITDKFDVTRRATYVYDGTVQLWMRIDTLDLDSEAPLSARNLDGLASILAVRVVDQFGDTNLSQLTMRSANKYQLALVTRFGGDEAEVSGW